MLKTNRYIWHGDKIRIYFFNSPGNFFVIDKEDLEKTFKTVNRWTLDDTGYAQGSCRQRKRRVRLHRLLMGALDSPRNEQVDHINRDKLNNTRVNLRMVTPGQNSYNAKKRVNNKSGYIGVSYRKRKGDWYASISKDNKSIGIGYYGSALEAAIARDKMAIELHGECAHLNFSKDIVCGFEFKGE